MSSDSEESEVEYGGIRDQLSSALDDLDADEQGSFAFRRAYTDAPNPTLRLAEFGHIGLPLNSEQAKAVIALCEQAPFGMGERTVVDKDVRDTWELDASKVSFDHPGWKGYLDRVVSDVCEALGVDEARSRPRCELYKLLIYETGSHFLPHVDTEKANNMFATIVVVLPTEFTGGDAHLSHCGRSMVLNTSRASLTSTTVLAWYTDVKHEIKSITSGYRLALAYNLVHTTTSLPPSLPDNSEEAEHLRSVLRSWNDMADTAPDKIVFLLDHKYSRANLSARALKGPDARKVAVLDEAAKQVGLCMGLANFRHVVRGTADDPHDRYHYGDHDCVDMDWQEEFYTDSFIENLVDLDGRLLRAEKLKFEENLNTVPSRFVKYLRHDSEPDNKKYEGYMGNGAGTLEQVYRMSVLVIWPKWSELAHVGGDRRAVYVEELLAASQSPEPTREEEEAFTYVLRSTRKGSLATLCSLARRWKRADLWRSAMLTFGHDDCTAEVMVAVETLGFHVLSSSIREFVRMLTSNAARFRMLSSLRSWAQGQCSDPAVLAAVDVFLREEALWLLHNIKPATKHEIKLLTDEALKYGGVHLVETTLVPQIRASGDLVFEQAYANFLARDVAPVVTAPEETAALGRAVDDLLCDYANKADFFPIPDAATYRYTANPRPPPSHQPAFKFLKTCLDQGRTSIAARALWRMLDDVDHSPAQVAPSRGIAVLLPLVSSLREYLILKGRSLSSMDLPLSRLGRTAIDATLKSDVAKNGRLTAPDVTALMEAAAMGDMGEASVLFSSLVLGLKNLPWNESSWRICMETMHSRRSDSAFSAIRPPHFDLALQKMATKYARLVNYASYPGDELRALFNLCADVGGLDCLRILLDRAVEPSSLRAYYVETTLLQMVGPLAQTARDRHLALTSEPFARIVRTIMCTWIETCLGPRPDEARIQDLLATLSQYTCACADCTLVRKHLNGALQTSGWHSHEECYLAHIGAARYSHVESELFRWARHIATWEPSRSGKKGIRVRMNDVIPASRRWKEKRATGIKALQSVGCESELKGIFGTLYPQILDVLRPSEEL